ncbi:MAG: hypothetical protein K9N52_06395 [Verrucomicrobia bacterium]|nr:hypothetical protein [Verrucomicrobiota bacterium]
MMPGWNAFYWRSSPETGIEGGEMNVGSNTYVCDKSLITWSVILVFLLHLFFLWYFSKGPPGKKRQVPEKPEFAMPLESAYAGELEELAELRDPSVFALADIRGFSGHAWLKNDEFEPAPIDLTAPPMEGFVLRPDDLGKTFPDEVVKEYPELLSFIEKPAPELNEPLVPNVTAQTQTVVRVEGELSGREVLTRTEYPAWRGTDVLDSTVFNVAVDNNGAVFSVRAVSSSGSAAADARAMEYVKQLRFAPVFGADDETALCWGRMNFLWAVLPPGSGGLSNEETRE